MQGRLRGHLTYANVTATLALLVALGGTSYAALRVGSGEIVNNSVRSVDVRNNSLLGRDIRNRSLTARDIERNSLEGSAIYEGSLGTVREARLIDGRSVFDLTVKCPADTDPAGGACVEMTTRAPNDFLSANDNCGRLPLYTELLEAAGDAPTAPEWTSNILEESGGVTTTLLRGPGGVTSASTNIGLRPYRCARPLTN